jgi:hypothetical protein
MVRNVTFLPLHCPDGKHSHTEIGSKVFRPHREVN